MTHAGKFVGPTLSALALVMVLGPAAPALSNDPVVASVDGRPIHLSDVAEAKTRLPAQLADVPDEAIFPLIVNSLVDTRLAAAAARKAGLGESPEVKAQVARLEEQILERALISKHVQEGIDEALLRQRYDQLVAEQAGRQETRARHILVETEAQAQEITAQLQKGADFAELARSRSTCPSAPRGGDLGYFGEGEMVPEFSKAVDGLAVGGMSPTPVQTQFGWHVIKVEDRRDRSPMPFDQAKEEIRAEVARELMAELVQSLRAKADIKLFNPDGSPAAGSRKK